MKVIDLYLAIERNINIPKKVVYKYKTYRYYPEYKQYYREEYGDMISLFLEATMDDKVYLIEDTPKEDKKIEKIEERIDTSLVGTEILDEFKVAGAINKQAGYTFDIAKKINEIIDKINLED